ncbi:acyl-CoA dehydrogenase [Nocardioides sp. IC4_145]|uniref:acyl-CoA dehydrogenase family protein n=1 Tax=Nocardioides sp. IC4_145 TaxID=2714037 RepID=UPI00140BD0E4|nr:acyl-CoA dehydrogenase family protein [Nocardioides sp. IC4_145]NHC21881.1 acyl-CoA dehydrogenase [Nocardioides sp. IC4_145]
MTLTPDRTESLEDFAARASDWLKGQGLPRRGTTAPGGPHTSSLAVFHDLSFDEEAALIGRLTDWVRRRYDAGFGAISWPTELGGAGLPPSYEQAFARAEAKYDVPDAHELVSVTLQLIAPTLRVFDRTPELRALVGPMLRGDVLACQLFSEPGAGSDLAGLGTRARRDGDQWVVTGQKVWTSGAQFAQWGELLARTDPDAPKHRGITAFMVPLDAEGVEIRPLRQMSGGSSFNEVFLTEVRIPDAWRIGEVGEGWKVALTTLGFERTSSGENTQTGAGLADAIALARTTGALGDPVLRQRLADLVVSHTLGEVALARDAAAAGRDSTDVVGSMRKLQWVNRLRQVSAFAQDALGPGLVVDDGTPDSFAWTEHVLGAPGYRIAGGSDEIQRNLIAERMLGLPAEPRADKNTPWKDIPR